MHYLELGLEMLLEKDALRPCDTSACPGTTPLGVAIEVRLKQ